MATEALGTGLLPWKVAPQELERARMGVPRALPTPDRGPGAGVT
jgi:hypothetical protein